MFENVNIAKSRAFNSSCADSPLSIYNAENLSVRQRPAAGHIPGFQAGLGERECEYEEKGTFSGPVQRTDEPNVAIILVIVAVLTYILPAGAFDRVADLETGYDILDVDSFHYIDQNPVGFLAFFTSLTVGMQSAASIIFFLFVVGGLFQIVEHTGALKAALANMIKTLHGVEILFIPICVFVCGLISATAGTWEEYLAILPLVHRGRICRSGHQCLYGRRGPDDRRRPPVFRKSLPAGDLSGAVHRILHFHHDLRSPDQNPSGAQ